MRLLEFPLQRLMPSAVRNTQYTLNMLKGIPIIHDEEEEENPNFNGR